MQYKNTLITCSLALTSLLSANDITASNQDIRAFVLPQGTLSMRANYGLDNEDVDIFNLNDTQSSINPYEHTQESSHVQASLAYGLHPHISLYTNYNLMYLDYDNSQLQNQQLELYTRINFYDVPHYTFDDFSMDIGYKHDEEVGDEVLFSGAEDDAYYLRFLLGSRLTHSLFNLYAGYQYAKIDHHDKSINTRDEQTLSLGVSHTYEFGHYILDSHYEYLHVLERDEAFKKSEDNHIFKVKFSRILSKNLLVFVGTDIMLNHYNARIPYLFNSHTHNTFDNHSYSTLELGFSFNFSLLGSKKR